MPVYLLVRVPEQLAVVLLVLASMLVVSMYRGSTIEALEPHVALVENAALLYCAPAGTCNCPILLHPTCNKAQGS